MAISLKQSNVLGGGLASWKIRSTNASTGAEDVAYYTLPYPFQGKFIDKTLQEVDTRAVEAPHAIDFGYSARFMCTNKTNLIKIIPDIVRNPADHIYTFLNGRTGSSAYLHSKQMGLNFKLVFDSDMQNARYLELMADRKIMVQPLSLNGTAQFSLPTALIGTGTNFLTSVRVGDIITLSSGDIVTVTTVTNDTTLVVSGGSTEDTGLTMTINDWTNFLRTPPAVGTPTITDILYKLNSLTRSSIIPGGVRTVRVREISSSSWTHVLGKINKFKLTIEGIGEQDQEGRTVCNLAKFSLSLDMMQSKQDAELIDIQTLAGQENEFQLEFIDSLVLNLLNPSNIGLTFEIHNDVDSTGNQFISIAGNGVISLLGTTFADLWE
jgi:hypothetical protein